MNNEEQLSPARREAMHISPAVVDMLWTLVRPLTLTKEHDRFDMGVEFQKSEIIAGLEAQLGPIFHGKR